MACRTANENIGEDDDVVGGTVKECYHDIGVRVNHEEDKLREFTVHDW
tara:strand:- start:369 stop:512 length:144 start_codon:yes stop_codon:yes gene_type:complete